MRTRPPALRTRAPASSGARPTLHLVGRGGGDQRGARPPLRGNPDRARGHRPEELWALERCDVDLEAGVPRVERVHSQGVLKDCRKSSRQRRRVPLRQRVVDALRTQPPRLDTPLVFPAARGGHVDLAKFRARHWAPALRAVDIEHRRIYDCRRTFASWALRDGVALLLLSRIIGISISQLDNTYG